MWINIYSFYFKVSATKKFSLERAPIALCIQLKRFSMLGNKINKPITIKTRLDLSKYASSKAGSSEQQHPLIYKLVAMVTHIGSSQHCGHYTAIGLTESGAYYNYDDSYVRQVSVQNVCNTNAYIIFYEMENAPATSKQVSCTQVSGAMLSENKVGQIKMNGNVVGASPQRPMIGPQLPPGGLNKLQQQQQQQQTMPNGILPSAAGYSNGSSKMSINRQGAIPTSSSNNTIHFKNQINNNSNVNGSQISKTIATSPCSNNNNNTQNGPLMGTGKFQEFSNTNHTLVGSSNKEQIGADSNGNSNINKSRCSSPSFSTDNEDEVSSSTQSSKSKLPSMPQLMECNSSNNNSNNHKTMPTPCSTPKSQGNLTKAPNCNVILPTKISKSLVPYESESDEDMDSKFPTSTNANSNNKFSSAAATLAAAIHKNPLKRRSSLSSGNSGSSDDEAHSDEGPSNGIKIKKAASSGGLGSAVSQFKAKSKSHDDIDQIFGYQNGKRLNSPLKKLQQKSQSQQFVVSSTTTNSNNNSDDDDEEHQSKKSYHKRSNSTPNSPPVMKTPSGLWQVTALPPVETKSLSGDDNSSSANKASKNPKNPFASKSPELQLNKRSKLSGNNEKNDKNRTNGNGLATTSSTGSNSVVTELLKQTHRGYGAPVLTWNGQQTEIEREVS